MMTLGDFFTTAPYSRPVNARPVKFTAVAKGGILPGGKANPHKRQVAAEVTAAMVFLGGDGNTEARAAARKAVADKFFDKETGQRFDHEQDYFAELTFQMIFRFLREWDADEKVSGDRLFKDIDNMRELLELSEADRVMAEYNKYIKEEHPEAPPVGTFRDAKDGSQKVA